MAHRLASLWIALTIFHVTPANALEEPRASSFDDAQPRPRVWYGWQILLVDVSSFGAAALSTRDSGALGTTLGAIGITGYLAGGPIVHAVHGRPFGIVAGSFALRLVLPVLGGVLGSAFGESASNCQSRSDNSGDGQSLDGLCGLSAFDSIIVGVGIGFLTASILDVAALSWTRSPKALPILVTASLRPTVNVVRAIDDRRVMTFGFVGEI